MSAQIEVGLELVDSQVLPCLPQRQASEPQGTQPAPRALVVGNPVAVPVLALDPCYSSRTVLAPTSSPDVRLTHTRPLRSTRPSEPGTRNPHAETSSSRSMHRLALDCMSGVRVVRTNVTGMKEVDPVYPKTSWVPVQAAPPLGGTGARRALLCTRSAPLLGQSGCLG